MSERIEAIIATLSAKPDPAHLAAVTDAIRACELAVNDKVGDVDQTIASLSALTGRDWKRATFFELWGWTSPEELAETVANPVVDPIHDLSKAELTRLFEAIEVAAGKDDAYIEFLNSSYPGSFSTDLIYYPYEEMDAAARAAEVLRRQSILDDSGAAALEAYEVEIATSIRNAADARPWQIQWAAGVLKRPGA